MSKATEQMNEIRAELTDLVRKQEHADFAALCDFDPTASNPNIFRIKAAPRPGAALNEHKLHKLALAERAYYLVSPYRNNRFHDDEEMFVSFVPTQNNLTYLIVKAAPKTLTGTDREDQYENFQMIIHEEAKLLLGKTETLVRALRSRS